MVDTAGDDFRFKTLEQSLAGSEYPGTNMVDYPFPLRADGPIAHLCLPRDLKATEVARLHKFLLSLV